MSNSRNLMECFLRDWQVMEKERDYASLKITYHDIHDIKEEKWNQPNGTSCALHAAPF